MSKLRAVPSGPPPATRKPTRAQIRLLQYLERWTAGNDEADPLNCPGVIQWGGRMARPSFRCWFRSEGNWIKGGSMDRATGTPTITVPTMRIPIEQDWVHEPDKQRRGWWGISQKGRKVIGKPSEGERDE